MERADYIALEDRAKQNIDAHADAMRTEMRRLTGRPGFDYVKSASALSRIHEAYVDGERSVLQDAARLADTSYTPLERRVTTESLLCEVVLFYINASSSRDPLIKGNYPKK